MKLNSLLKSHSRVSEVEITDENQNAVKNINKEIHQFEKHYYNVHVASIWKKNARKKLNIHD